jgi:hypothetical protein
MKYTEETEGKIENQREANREYKSYMADGGEDEERQRRWKKLQQTKTAAKEAKQAEEREKETTEVREIGTKRPHQVKKLWKYIKKQTPRYVTTPTIKTKMGRIVDRKEIAKEVVRHVQKLNTPHQPRVDCQ